MDRWDVAQVQQNTGGDTNQQSQHLLADITGTVNSIKSHDWVSAGLGLTNVSMDIIGMSGNPLSGLLSAGIGWLVEHVKFLREPFDTLLGDPESINSTARNWANAGSLLNQVATQLRSSSTGGTSGWTGDAGDAYRTASDTRANAADSLGNASGGMSAAMTQVGQVLASVRKAVLDLITKAVQKIIQIIIEALSSSWATFGTSIVAGIVRAVQTAVSAAQQAASKVSQFVQSAQRVSQLVQKVQQASNAVKELTPKNEDTSEPVPEVQPVLTAASDTPTVNTDYRVPDTGDGVSQNGWPVDPPRHSRLIPGTHTKVQVVDGPGGEVLLSVLAQVAKRVENPDVNDGGELDDWGYAHRNVRGSSDVSNHASATAVDINADRHPLGERGTFTPAQVEEIHKILAEHGGVVRWGGDYHGRVDEMHFELNADQAEVAEVAKNLPTYE